MNNQPSTAIASWGDRNDVRELKARLSQMALMVPGGAKLDDRAILALAQASVLHGLDPLNGEIWIIPGSGVMIGIKGLRKKAREQVQGNFWVNFRMITSPEERAALGIPAGALAYEALLFDTETINTYTTTVERMLKAGMPWEIVERMVGAKPYTSGLGYATPGEKSKMDLAQRASKRAEADAIKRRFDVPFGVGVAAEGEGPVFEGEWIENQPAARAEPTAEEQAQQQAVGDALYPRDEAEQVATPTAEPNLEASRAGWPAAEGHVPAPEPAAAPATEERPAARVTTIAVMKVKDREKAAAWRTWGKKFAERYPAYQTTVKGQPSGQPDFHHILGAARKCVFTEVTDDNVADVMRAIEARAAEAAVPA